MPGHASAATCAFSGSRGPFSSSRDLRPMRAPFPINALQYTDREVSPAWSRSRVPYNGRCTLRVYASVIFCELIMYLSHGVCVCVCVCVCVVCVTLRDQKTILF